MSTDSEKAAHLLRNAKTIAIVGLSSRPDRPSYGVALSMKQRGYKIIPVNPQEGEEVLGEKNYPDLLSVPDKIDIVNIFRRPNAVPPVVDQAIEVKAGSVWMQLGIVNEEAAEKARAAGLGVVMDRCIAVDARMLLP